MNSDNRFPSQIKYIIGNEACERFSFYGMRTILVIFMTQHLAVETSQAKAVYHLFNSGCYLMPLVGAFIADRFWGKYNTILYVSLLYCLGHGVLAMFESTAGLYAGLALIAMGAGGIKPCVSAFVGDQFTEEKKHLLEKVFSIFYFSINFGAFFSSLLTPILLTRYGASVAFGIPGVLMGIATIIFWLGRKQYVIKNPDRSTLSAGFLPIFWCALTHQKHRRAGQTFFDAALVRYTAAEVNGAKAAAAVFKLFFGVAVFWSLFDQQGSSWTLQADRMNRNFFGINLEASQIQALNPILVMVLIPIFSYGVYPLVEKLGIRVTPLRKMSAGMIFAALSFVIVGFCQQLLDHGRLLSVGWQVLAYTVITCSEVMISITGLEFAYTQAPPSMKSTIMSFWLLTVFFGNILAAYVSEINVFKGAGEFYFYAMLMFAVSLIFSFAAYRYRSPIAAES